MRTLGSAIVTHCVRLSTPRGAGHPANPVWPARTAPVTARMVVLLIRRRRTTGGRACNPRQGRAGRDAAGHCWRQDLRKIAVTGVAPRPGGHGQRKLPPAVPPDRGRRRPDGGRHGRSKPRTSRPATKTQPGRRPTVCGGRRETASTACGVTACGRPGHTGARALMSKRCSKGQYGAYDRAPQGDLPAAVCIQPESGQFPLAVLGMVRQ